MLTLAGKFRWTIIGLFVGAMVINYLSRSVLGVAAPVILAEQKISNIEYGWITGAFQLGVMLQPAAGYFLDSVGLRVGFALCVALWSLITMAHGLVNGWFGFAALRGLLGLAEGSAQPAGQKLVAEWFPSRERGAAGGACRWGAFPRRSRPWYSDPPRASEPAGSNRRRQPRKPVARRRPWQRADRGDA